MAIQVGYGDDMAFRALVYGAERHPGTINYLENSVSSVANLSNTLTEAGQQFFANSREMLNSFTGSQAMQLARAALNKMNNLFSRTDIHFISELDKLQNAQPIMQRFIMAQPDVREIYHQQRCDGYSDTYVDMEPGGVGENHYDYRRVMNGIFVADEEGNDKVSIYLDTLHEGDRELSHDEQTSILKTWEVVANLIKYGGEDPTSIWGDSL